MGNNNNDNHENVDDAAARREKRLKLNSIVDRQDQFPARQRNKIDELVDLFLDSLGDDIHEMLCNQDSGENYRGLDSDRDTEAEVETVVRFFPHVLSQRGGRYDWYPIKCLTTIYDNGDFVHNLKAVSFVHVLARLAIEFDTFEDHERGGLIDDENYNNVL